MKFLHRPGRDAEGEPHVWTPQTLIRDLTVRHSYNVRLRDGQLARVYAHRGYWHVVREDETSVDGLTLGAMARWLNEQRAAPLGKDAEP